MFNLKIIDVSAVVYKGTFAANYKDRNYYNYPVGGIHYLMRQIATALAIGDSVVLVFDSPNNFRKNLNPNYKGQRQKNNAIITQIQTLWDELPATGLTCYRQDGYEGDDLINWCVKQMVDSKSFFEIFIIGNDKDLLHNVQPNVTFKSISADVNTVTSNNFTYSIFKDRTVPYNFISAYKVFFGCSSDNVPAFKSDNGLKNEELFNAYVSLFQMKEIPYIWEYTTNPKILKSFITALSSLTDRDKEDLNTRVDIIYPADNPGITFTPIGFQQFNKTALSKFLTLYNDYESLKCLDLSKAYLSDDDREFIKQKAYKFKTGAFAVDNNLEVNNLVDSEDLYLKEF